MQTKIKTKSESLSGQTDGNCVFYYTGFSVDQEATSREKGRDVMWSVDSVFSTDGFEICFFSCNELLSPALPETACTLEKLCKRWGTHHWGHSQGVWSEHHGGACGDNSRLLGCATQLIALLVLSQAGPVTRCQASLAFCFSR